MGSFEETRTSGVTPLVSIIRIKSSASLSSITLCSRSTQSQSKPAFANISACPGWANWIHEPIETFGNWVILRCLYLQGLQSIKTLDGYLEWISNNGLVIAQVESSQSVENLAEILSVDGVGGFMVGPYDLSCSLEVPGKLDHPLVLESLEKIMLVAREFPLAKRGIHKTSIDHQPVLNAIEEGFNFIAYSTDMLFLGESCRLGMRKIRESLNG